MNVEIDLAADAAAIEWAPRARGMSQLVGRPGGRGVRLYYNEAGEVVGLEVLGWSRRAAAPAEVRLVVHPAESAPPREEDHPFARALAEGLSVETDQDHRPLYDGRPLLSLAEAAARTGRERSWLSREMAAGRLRAVKIGRGWWTAPEWVEAYATARRGAARGPRSGGRAALGGAGSLPLPQGRADALPGAVGGQ